MRDFKAFVEPLLLLLVLSFACALVSPFRDGSGLIRDLERVMPSLDVAELGPCIYHTCQIYTKKKAAGNDEHRTQTYRTRQQVIGSFAAILILNVEEKQSKVKTIFGIPSNFLDP